MDLMIEMSALREQLQAEQRRSAVREEELERFRQEHREAQTAQAAPGSPRRPVLHPLWWIRPRWWSARQRRTMMRLGH